jgi:hypothetical protein
MNTPNEASVATMRRKVTSMFVSLLT